MKEALKLALEALEKTALIFGDDSLSAKATKAIKEALAQPTSADYAMGYAEGFNDACKKPKQELVAWPCVIKEADFSENTVTLKMQCTDYKVSAGKHWLYTTPPKRKD